MSHNETEPLCIPLYNYMLFVAFFIHFTIFVGNFKGTYFFFAEEENP